MPKKMCYIYKRHLHVHPKKVVVQFFKHRFLQFP